MLLNSAREQIINLGLQVNIYLITFCQAFSHGIFRHKFTTSDNNYSHFLRVYSLCIPVCLHLLRWHATNYRIASW
jgi:hypothetical protein